MLAGALLASSAALLFAACGDDHHDHLEVRGGHRDHCAEYATCGSCTPIEGCGWCTYEDGSGACSSEPDRCSGSTFRWNWEPAGCSTSADAGPVLDTTPPSDAPLATDAPTDAPSDAPGLSDAPTNIPGDSATTDASETSSSDAATTCTAPSGATLACVQTVGGSLCASGEYTLACHADEGGTPVPGASYGCKTVPTTSTSTTFYCCPCLSP